MKSFRYSLFLGLLFPLLSLGQNKWEREISRDVANLAEQIRNLQASLEQRINEVKNSSDKASDLAYKSNIAIAQVEGAVRDRLRDQEKVVQAPILGMGTRVDQMTTELQSVKESLAELSRQLAKLQTQLVDVSNAVRTLSAPPPPPSFGAPAPGAASSVPPTGVSADSIFQNALRDRSSGRLDLAMTGFQDYLKWFPTTDYAPNAQYYIGDILYARGEYDNALQAFDLVLEKYPTNSKTPDARYMKAQALLKLNQRNAAVQELRELIRTSPGSDLATKASSELRRMGINPPVVQKKKR
jgi:tol-pal system protein YbgF